MKKECLFFIFLIIPIFHLYSQITFSDQIIINNSKIEGVNSGSNEKSAWHQNQNLSLLEFKVHSVDANVRGVNSIISGDIDGDGDVDVLGAALYLNEIAWWENLDLGSGSFYKHTIDADFYMADKIYATDLDGDDDIDVLGGSYQGNEIAWWENTQSDTFTKHLIDGDFKRSVSVLGVDIDNDGDMDVLGASKLDNDIVWWENDGSENFTKKIVDSNFLSVSRVYAADIDSDGDMDVVGVRSSQIAWWENNGTQNFSKHIIYGNLSFGYGVFATDLDSDGDVDVLGADRYGNEIAWWENDSLQNFTKDSLDAEIGRPSWLYATDLDNDDDVDILAVSYTDDYVCWYENLGSKNFDKHILQSYVSSACAVHADDFDNDGDVDILGAASQDIYWWENTLIANPNPLKPDISVMPDSLFFYVGPGKRMENDLSWTENASDYAQLPIVSGEQSGFEDTVAVIIKNTGDATLYVQNISSETNWIVDIDTTNFLLKPEQEKMVKIMCSAKDLFNGIYNGNLTINSNDPETPLLDLPLLLEMRGGLDVNFVEETEPNNSETEAQKIYPPSPAGIKGNISVSDVGDIYLSVFKDDIEDLYEFKIQSGSIKIKLYDFTADLDFYLMQIVGNTITIWGSNHRGGVVDEEFEKTDLVPGTYFVGVTIYDNYPIQDSSSYSLALVGDIVTEIKKFDTATPNEFSLGQNYPNPFNPTTIIKYSLPKEVAVTLRLFNMRGQEVKTLVNKKQLAGNYAVEWDGRDNNGIAVSTGIYFYRIEAGKFSKMNKMLLIK